MAAYEGRRPRIDMMLPLGFCLAILLLSILPLGMAGAGGAIGPYLVIWVIYFWAVRLPGRLPVAAIFACGVAIDLFTAGPLGFWPLVYLISHGFSALSARLLDRRGYAALCGGFCLVSAGAGIVAWGLGCLYFGAWIDLMGPARGVAATCLAFPVLALVFGRLTRTAPVAA
jgi:rod shape-determining protein MreD